MIEYYKKALDIDPSSADNYHNLGLSLAYQDKMKSAIDSYLQSIKLRSSLENRSLAETYFLLAEAYNHSSNKIAAEKAYIQAIEIDDNCALAFAGLGHADVITGWHYEYDQHERKNRFISGADLAIKAKELDSKLGLAYSTLMLSWLLQNEKNKAREIADEAIRICPNDPLAYRASGIIYNAMGEYDEAINSANTAIELDPLDHVGYLLLMNCHYSSGNVDGVITIYERELSISSSDDLPPYDWSIILSAYLKVGKNDKVEYIRQQIERAFPEFGPDNLRMATAVLAEDVSMDLTRTAGPYLPRK